MSHQNDENDAVYNEVIYVVERATDKVTAIVHRSSNGNFSDMRGKIIWLSRDKSTVKLVTENGMVATFRRTGVATYEALECNHWPYPKRVQIG